jgi:hypothetical protein
MTIGDMKFFVTKREESKDRHLHSKPHQRPPHHWQTAEKKTNSENQIGNNQPHGRQTSPTP